MRFESITRDLRRARRVVVLCAAAGAAIALGLDARSGPVFEANTQVFVTAAPGAAPLEAAALAQKAGSYARLATSEQVVAGVTRDVRLPYANDRLAEHVQATNEPGTVLLDIRVRDASPVLARDIADSVATHLAETVTSLENPDGSGAASVALQVTQRAVAAREPIGPDRLRDSLFGGGLGLLLGLGIALARALLDPSVRTRSHVEARGGHLLAEIPEDDSAAKLPLILSDPFGARAEGIRRLRTNLRGGSRTASGRPVRSVVVTSALPGEGRTTTACNLAIALAQNGDEVVLVDADLRRGALADVMDISATTGLTNVLAGERPLAEALHTWRPELPLRVLPSGPLPPNPSEVAGSAQLAALVGTLTDNGLTVVLDAPPLLPVTDAALLATATDGAVVVVRSGTSTREDLQACLDALSASGARSLGVVLNRTTARTLTLPPVAASPRRSRAEVRHAKATARAPRTAPPDTLAGSVTSWYDQQGQAPAPAAAEPIHQLPEPVREALPRPIELPPAAPVYEPLHAVHLPASPIQQPIPQPIQLPLPQPSQPVPSLPRQAPHYDPSATIVPATAPISTPPSALPVVPTVEASPFEASPFDPVAPFDPEAPPSALPGTVTAFPPISRREARRRLAAVPDDETREVPRPVVRHDVRNDVRNDVRTDVRHESRAEATTQKVDLRDVSPRVPSLGSPDNGSVWAPPWQSRSL